MTDRPTKTIKVRHYGICGDDGNIPYDLAQFLYAIQAAFNEVPIKYLQTAEVDCEPDYEYGEHYAAVRITYERPMTDDELAEYRERERNHWNEQKAAAEARASYCAQQLADTFGGE